mmetsp:Transcript_5005/g.9553  ORF Transcript_5005/g.9553 Transcript_5005/m.9553 type:complete len:89 (-) Transcript_5005:119-385(-)
MLCTSCGKLECIQFLNGLDYTRSFSASLSKNRICLIRLHQHSIPMPHWRGSIMKKAYRSRLVARQIREENVRWTLIVGFHPHKHRSSF